MITYYERAKAQPEIFNPLVCRDPIFVHYYCPLESSKLDKSSRHNYILYILSEKRLVTLRIGLWYLQKSVLYS